MRTVDEHLADCLAAVAPLAAARRCRCSTRTAACSPRTSSSPSPCRGFDNSSMDGYAVRAADVAGATAGAPVELPVVGRHRRRAAGGRRRCSPGTALRIMTGAPMPHGRRRRRPVEWTDGGRRRRCAIDRRRRPAQHVRRAGEDVAVGEIVLAAGTGSAPRQLGAARRRRPRPRAVPPARRASSSSPPAASWSSRASRSRPGRSTTPTATCSTAAAARPGACAYRVGIVPDDPRELLDALEDQLHPRRPRR